MNQTLQDPDRWLWPFELLDKIGEGGMGVVYRARYVKDDRLFAIKLLPAEVNDEVILARFERELDILKTMRHPNIVRCFGGVCENTRRFYAMELVEGGTLDELLATQGRLPWPQVVEYGLQMCAALAYAHERTVVHRDVKPGNFLIAKNGQLKLSDFGLASVEAARKITQAGKTMGTYRYMSPEQIRGKAEPRTDLYALGCVLFEMLTGRPPFLGDTAGEILQKHVNEPPPHVSSLVSGVPPSLEQLILDLLEKDPDKRPASATEVARRLNEADEVVAVAKRIPGAVTVATRPTIGRDEATVAAVPQRRQAGIPVWASGAALLAMVVLLFWCLSLRNSQARFREAEELWIDAYQQSDLNTRVKASAALGQLARHSDRALETLTAGLAAEAEAPTVENRQVRAATVEALGESGRRDLIATLTKVQREDPETMVSSAANSAIMKLKNAPRESAFWWSTLHVLIVAVALGTFAWIWRRATVEE